MKGKKPNRLEYLVAYSPTIIFGVMIVGVILHNFFPIMLSANPLPVRVIGFVVMLVAPLFIIWSQRIRRTLYLPVTDQTCFNFYVGPYRFSRHPTYLALIMLLAGFGLLLNSVLILALAGATWIFFTLVIIPLEERELCEHCGGIYEPYRNKVRMWL